MHREYPRTMVWGFWRLRLKTNGIDLSYATLWRLEIGEARIPDPQTLTQIAAATGYTPGELSDILTEKPRTFNEKKTWGNSCDALTTDSILALAEKLSDSEYHHTKT